LSARQRTASAAICLLLLSLTAISARSAAPGNLRVVFINVGQGDAALLDDANGFDVLIDGGPIPAGTTVIQYLRDAGVDDIDVLVASHTDADHIGGLIAVLQAADIPVEAVVVNGYSATTDAWADFLAAASARGLTPTVAQFPQTFQWGEMSVQVLNPVGGLANPDPNDVSLVLRIQHGEIGYLFPGDIDSTIEGQVLARGTPVAAQVLKVAHHGSAYSSSAAFLQAAAPQQAVISVGNNSYGHPALDALARLSAAGAQIWRTDRSGNIQILSDGFLLTVIPEYVLSEYFLPLVVRVTPATPEIPGTGKILIQSVVADGLGAQDPDEYVVIKNTDNHPVNLESWTISDTARHVFLFPRVIIQVNQVCRIYTNQDHPEWCGLSYHSGSAIWNNDHDCATLKNGSAEVVSSYCY
jgi:competence protein ComEC